MKRLYISSNNLTSLPESIGNLLNLAELSISGNNLTSLPESIGNLESLIKLDIWGCYNLKKLPDSIGNLKNLTELSIKMCTNLENVPNSIGNLKNLTWISISGHTNLDELFDSIRNLDRLTKLTISGYEKDINHLTGITIPECKNMNKIPNSIGMLKNLKSLKILNYSELEILPESIVNLTNLKVLFINDTMMQTLSDWIGTLSNLTRLDISHNQLTEIPKSIGNLSNLTRLDISRNQLTDIPDRIGNLSNLTHLDISSNRLSTLPDWIGILRNLTTLEVNRNNLTSLPISLINLRNLAFFYYYDNPIEYIPPQVERLMGRRNGNNLYSDSQSVHNTDIQRSFRESVERITKKKCKYDFDETMRQILNSSLNKHCKESLVEYCNNEEPHVVLQITFKELLPFVWERIVDNEHKEEILRILENEMSDSECKCFTGRLTRLVNTLNGFDSDIVMNISDKEQINNLLIIIRGMNDEIDKKVEYFEKEMMERGYSEEIINEWIEYIE